MVPACREPDRLSCTNSTSMPLSANVLRFQVSVKKPRASANRRGLMSFTASMPRLTTSMSPAQIPAAF